MFLVDTNVWLELLLEQEKANEVRKFFQETKASEISITEFSLYSIGIVLYRLKKDALFEDFVSDIIEDSDISKIVLSVFEIKTVIETGRRFNLDFDDAYQYVAALEHGLTLVSFDKDFDTTELGKKTPSEALIS